MKAYLTIASIILLHQYTLAQFGLFHKDQHQYSYFLTPTGFPPLHTKAIYQNGMLGINQYQTITENGNSRGIGMIPTLILGADYMPVWVFIHRRFPIGGTPKKPGWILNTGGFFLKLPRSTENNDFSLFYANVTFGEEDRNIAFGGGVVPTGLGKGEIASCMTLHALTRLGKRSRLVSENYIIYGDKTLIPCSINGWRYWKRRTAIDVACMLVGVPGVSALDRRRWIPAPWISIHHNLRYPIF